MIRSLGTGGDQVSAYNTIMTLATSERTLNPAVKLKRELTTNPQLKGRLTPRAQLTASLSQPSATPQ